MFANDYEERNSWNEGFRAGLKEALDELNRAASMEDSESPSQKWLQEFSIKIENKFF